MIAVDIDVVRGAFRLEAAFRSADPLTAVFGASGCGKTTLLHALCGLLRPTRGRIAVGDDVLFDAGAGIDVPVHRRRIGVVFQDARLFPHRSVRGNLRYGERLADPTRRLLGFDETIELLDLGALLERPVPALSGGERQRVALGRALLAAPRALLLDEPLAALDRGRTREVLGYLRRLRERVALPMLYVSHDLGELLQLTDRLLLMHDGRVADHGSLHNLAQRPGSLELLYDCGLLNVVAGTVQASDRGTVTLRAGAVDIVCGAFPCAAGERAAVALRPEDVALAEHDVAGTSFRNRLPGVVRAVTRASGRAVVCIDVGVELLVQVSLPALDELAIAPGRELWCLFKSEAVKPR